MYMCVRVCNLSMLAQLERLKGGEKVRGGRGREIVSKKKRERVN